MKEWTIRLLCVILGASITLGTIELRKFVDNYNESDIIEEPIEVTNEMVEVLEEEVDQNQLFEQEAEQMYHDLIENGNATTVVEAVEETGEPIDPSSIEAAPVKWKKDYPMINSDSTIEDKMCVRSSYEETMAVNTFDKMVIENSTVDFSDVKITVIGDSITAGSNLSAEEQQIYNWPSQLKEILGCKEVVNLGVGGSTVSRVIDSYPMVDRWQEIDAYSDIIIVMGGSNDMLFENKWQYGELDYDQRMTKGTFCGDFDEMLSGMKYVYKEHNDVNYCKFLCINPPSTVLNDGVYAINPENMVKQERFAEAINEIAPAYEFEVIDMYNNNILNSHDPDINAQYVYDGIHCNKEGYRIIAEHIASQIIQRIEQ